MGIPLATQPGTHAAEVTVGQEKIESGLFKMMAIGLGKFAGAQRYHTYAYKLGLEKVIRTVGRQVLHLPGGEAGASHLHQDLVEPVDPLVEAELRHGRLDQRTSAAQYN